MEESENVDDEFSVWAPFEQAAKIHQPKISSGKQAKGVMEMQQHMNSQLFTKTEDPVE